MRDYRPLLSAFLTEPRYKFWRILWISLIGGIITTNMTFTAYMDCHRALGNRIYLICFTSLLFYGFALITNYYYLIPKYLWRGNYSFYFICLLITAYLLPTLSTWEEYISRTVWDLPHRITSYRSPWILIDNLSSSILLLICLLSISALELFRKWKIQDEFLSRMEGENFRSEVNKLKGQITPAFLLDTLKNLRNTSPLPLPKPQK